MTSQPTHTDENGSIRPWLGLISYGEEDREFFFGREREVDELLRQLQREVLTVVFGVSGTGKTSLLNAGLFPQLRARNLLPVYIRLDHSVEAIHYVTQIRQRIGDEAAEAGCEIETIDSASDTADETESLWEFLHKTEFWDARNRPVTPVLVFDQFEEIFTLGANNPGRNALISELADLVENHLPESIRQRLAATEGRLGFPHERQNYKVLLSMREDFVARLDDLRRQMPRVMHGRFRLGRMNGNQGVQVITGPGSRLAAEPVAREIVRFVAGAALWDAKPATTGDDLTKLKIEPALLSVVCRELNERRIDSGETTITVAQLKSNRVDILLDFYERSFENVPRQCRVFVEDHLLTEGGYRRTVSLEEVERADVTPKAIDVLVGRRLLRIEERLSRPHVELSHDLLTDVVRKSRDLRRGTLRQWVKRNSGMAIAATIIVSILFTAFVGALVLWKRAEEASGRARQASHVANAAKVEVQERNTQLGKSIARQKELNESLRLQKQAAEKARADANNQLGVLSLERARQNGDPDNRLIVETLLSAGRSTGFEGLGGPHEKFPRLLYETLVNDRPSPQFQEATQLSLKHRFPLIWQTSYLQHHDEAIRAVCYTADGKTLVTSSDDATIRLWEVESGRLITTLQSQYGPIHALAGSPDGRWIASAGEGQIIELWDAAECLELLGDTQPAKRLSGHKLVVYDLCFSPDSRELASSSNDGTIRIWDLERFASMLTLQGHDAPIHSICYAPNGDQLASTGDDGTFRVWDLTSDEFEEIRPSENEYRSRSIAINAAGDRMACAIANAVLLYDLSIRGSVANSEVILQSPETERQSGIVHSVAFSHDGKRVFSAGEDRRIRVWNVEKIEFRAVDAQQEPAPTDADVNASQATGSNADKVSHLEATLEGHASSVYDLAVSPDGAVLASVDDDSTVRLWKSNAQGEFSRGGPPEPGHSQIVWRAVFSPNGQLIASAAFDDTIRLWDAATGLPREGQAVLRGHTEDVNGLVFHPDGRILASVSDDETVRVWDVATGSSITELAGDTGLKSVAFSPDGQTLVAVGYNKAVLFWQVSTDADGEIAFEGPEPSRAANGHSSIVRSVSFNSDGRMMATGGEDGRVLIWDREVRTVLQVYENPGAVECVQFSPSDPRLLVACGDGFVVRFEVGAAQPQGTYAGHAGRVYFAAFGASGGTLATAGGDQTIRLWDLHSGEVLAVFTGHRAGVSSVCFSPTGRTLASSSADRTLRLWDVDQYVGPDDILGTSQSESELISVDFGPKEKPDWVTAGDKAGNVYLWDRSKKEQPARFQLDSGQIAGLAFSPDGNWIAAGGSRGRIRLWNTQDEAQSYDLPDRHTGRVMQVAFSPDGQLLASASWDKTVRLWDMRQREEVEGGHAVLGGNGRRVMAVSLGETSDGLVVAAAGEDRVIRLWSATDGQPLDNRDRLTGHTETVRTISFSPDGQTLATSGSDQTVILWNLADGTRAAELVAHTETVNSVRFSPDGKWLASGDSGGHIILWNLDIAKPVFRLRDPGRHASISGLEFSVDGQSLAAAVLGAGIRLWKVPQAKSIPKLFLDGIRFNGLEIEYAPAEPSLTGYPGIYFDD